MDAKISHRNLPAKALACLLMNIVENIGIVVIQKHPLKRLALKIIIGMISEKYVAKIAKYLRVPVVNCILLLYSKIIIIIIIAIIKK